MNALHPIRCTVHRLLAIGLLLGLLTGCGNFSNEDLIFLASLPSREQLSLQVPGNEDASLQSQSSLQQNLQTCAEEDFFCQTRTVSSNLNTAVFGILDMVDAIALQHPPSQRQKNWRLWGPYFLETENTSIRFEMHRVVQADYEVFSYCLHAMKGRFDNDLAETIDCESELDDSGLRRILYGSFVPTSGASGARYAAGSLIFDLNALRRANLGKTDDKGRLLVDYLTENDSFRIELHIRDIEEQQVLLPSSADYVYQRYTDGSGNFVFEINADFVRDFMDNRLELFAIRSQWQAAAAGRADASISGGNLGASVVAATQCWNSDLDTSYYTDSVNQHPEQGTVSACVFAAPYYGQ